MAFIEPMHRNKPNITYLLRESMLICLAKDSETILLNTGKIGRYFTIIKHSKAHKECDIAYVSHYWKCHGRVLHVYPSDTMLAYSDALILMRWIIHPDITVDTHN